MHATVNFSQFQELKEGYFKNLHNGNFTALERHLEVWFVSLHFLRMALKYLESWWAIKSASQLRL